MPPLLCEKAAEEPVWASVYAASATHYRSRILKIGFGLGGNSTGCEHPCATEGAPQAAELIDNSIS